jgi:hypothetical protein
VKRLKLCEGRTTIDNVIVSEIEKTLVKFGVPKEKAFECYDAIRFQAEARAVLLNRVPERNNEEIGYYGAYLAKMAKENGVEYSPHD